MSALVIKTVKLPRRLALALSQAAKNRRKSESELIREGIERVTHEEDGLDMQALIGHDIGVARGPRDLSAKRKHLARYGRSRDR